MISALRLRTLVDPARYTYNRPHYILFTVCLLAMYMDEVDCFYVASCLMEQSRQSQHFFRNSNQSYRLFVRLAVHVVSQKLPDITKDSPSFFSFS